MQTRHTFQRFALMTAAALISGAALAYDAGNIYRFEESNARFHAEVIIETENRTLNVESQEIDRVLGLQFHPELPDDNDLYPQDVRDAQNARRDAFVNSLDFHGYLTSINILFRPTLFIGDQISIFADLGIYDDVDAIVSPPFVMGGGAKLTQEIFPDVNVVIFGKGHITEPYKFGLYTDLGAEAGDYDFQFQGRFISGTLGAVATTRIPLASVEVLPYVGGEASFVRSSATLQEWGIPGETFSFMPSEESIGRNVVDSNRLTTIISQREIFYLILGVTLKRPNNATIRVETKISQEDSTLGLGLGLMF